MVQMVLYSSAMLLDARKVFSITSRITYQVKIEHSIYKRALIWNKFYKTSSLYLVVFKLFLLYRVSKDCSFRRTEIQENGDE